MNPSFAALKIPSSSGGMGGHISMDRQVIQYKNEKKWFT
jgi:hypothetical protein